MSVKNFMPTIWEARLLAKFHERSVAELITTPPTKIEGNKIVFNKVSDVAIKDYTGDVSFDDLDTPKVEVDLDHKKYWAFKVDDVDAVQAAGNLIDPHIEEAGYGMQEDADKYVLTEALKSTNTVTVTNEKAYDIIVKLNGVLNKKKVSKANRFTVINSEVLEELQLDSRFTEHYQVLENGLIEGAKINGVQLVFSEELNAGKYAIVVLHKSAIGYGKQLQETEAMRLQNSFSDGVRGLKVEGCKTLKADGVAKYTKA